MEEKINFIDEKGQLRPLAELQEEFANMYKEMKTEMNTKHECEDFSILEVFVDPEAQIEPETVLNTFSFVERTIYLTQEIVHETAISVSDVIKFWNKVDNLDEVPPEERIPIKMYIDCPGGDLLATFSIIDTIKMSKTPIHTITIGSGDSGGFFIGICGHKRYGYPHSSYLFHEGSASNYGDAHKYLQNADFYKKQLGDLKQIVLENTNITEEEYEAHKKDDLWMTAQEALRYGVIDEISTEII